MKAKTFVAAGLALMGLGGATALWADEVIDWNKNLWQAALVANNSPLVAGRSAAILHAAIFDAVNGIERRYQPIHVPANAPRGASRRAAVIEAAYIILVDLYPAQKPDLDAKLAASLAALMEGDADDNDDGDNDRGDQSVLRGIAWGKAVADAIWAWRSTDGFTPAPPAFMGGTAVGQWRPTPPGFAAGAGPQFAYMTPWVLQSPSQFRPAGPPALTSAQYAVDFNETKSMGSLTTLLRTADQTAAARYWYFTLAPYSWNNAAVSLATQHHYSLSRNARLLALLNLSMADATIACWDAKYTFVFWRPETAIALADTDGNAATEKDTAWAPLLVTPNHPEYPSGHSTVSAAAATVLANEFGDNTAFTVDSNVLPGVTRSFTSFSASLREIVEARVFGGFHFRSACNDGQVTGREVGNYVLTHIMQRLHGHSHGHGHDNDRDHDWDDDND